MYDVTYEHDGSGDSGVICSIDAHGHLDDREVELFMATVVAEVIDNPDDVYDFGFEVEHLHRFEYLWQEEEESETFTLFGYRDEPGDGTTAVTRFQIASAWTKIGTDEPLVCVHHPDEPAAVGMPEAWFIDPGDRVIDGNVHYCRPCASAADERIREARRAALAEMKETGDGF